MVNREEKKKPTDNVRVILNKIHVYLLTTSLRCVFPLILFPGFNRFGLFLFDVCFFLCFYTLIDDKFCHHKQSLVLVVPQPLRQF